MGKINVEDLKPGMVLESDLICPTNGRFLMPAGAALDDWSLRTIKSWGCTEVDVKGFTAEDAHAEVAEELTPELIDQAQELVGPVFAFVDVEHPAMAELYRICVLRQAENLRRGVAPAPRPQAAQMDPEGELPPDRFLKGQGGPGELVSNEVKLASFPNIYFQIVEVLQSPKSSANHIAEVVSKDTSLTAKLLKLVNSPMYGFTAKIDSVSRAIALLGAEELSSLALGVSAIHVFKDVPKELADMSAFWRHSVACGLFARLVATQKPGLSTERFFVAGLLHDIGKLVTFKNLPQAATGVLRFSVGNSLPMVEAEQELLGFTHTELGQGLLEAWRFPPGLVDMVAWHHEPVKAETPLDAAVVHVADNLAIAMGLSSGGPPLLPGVNDTAWKVLGLSENIFVPAVIQFERQIADIMRAFQHE